MNATRKTLLSLMIASLAAMAADTALAQECGCTSGCTSCQTCPKGCGRFQCDCQCDKVCQPKCDMKKITITCWVCECKKICLAGPSCGCQGTCGRSRVVKHLIRKTITKEVPVVKCEAVSAAGCGCASGGCDAPAPADQSEAPQPPEASASYLPFDDGFTLYQPQGSAAPSAGITKSGLAAR